MDDLVSLRQEIDDLHQQVRRLQRTRWISPGLVGALLISLMAVGVAAPRLQDQQGAPPVNRPTQLAQDLVCKSIKIVKDTGTALIQLGSDADGGFIVLNGTDGKPRVFAAVEHGAGFTDWIDVRGTRRTSVFVGEQGHAEIQLRDAASNVAALLQEAETGGYLALHGPDLNHRLTAGVDNGGGYLDIFDSLGNMRQSFYLNEKNTPQFKMLAPDKSIRFLLSGDPEGGRAVAYDPAGKGKSFPSEP